MSDEFVCDRCHDVFQRREHLDRHLRTHTKEKPFACSLCEHNFSRVDALSRHYSLVHVKRGAEEERSKPSRVAKACKLCSLAKVRCDGQVPCYRCLNSGESCFYQQSKKRYVSSAKQNNVSKKLRASGEAHSQPLAIGESETIGIADMRIDKLPSALSSLSPDVLEGNNYAFSQPTPTSLANIERDPELALSHSSILDTTVWGPSAVGGYIDCFDWLLDSSYMGLSPFALPTAMKPTTEDSEINEFALLPTPKGTVTRQVESQYEEEQNLSRTNRFSAERYSQVSFSASGKDQILPQQYDPLDVPVHTDMPLTFPEMDNVIMAEVNNEDYAHVGAADASKFQAVIELARKMEGSSHYPHWMRLKIPPAVVLNVWIQLYFEHFHPLFPLLHNPTFASADTHPLLLFTVAAIGAMYSKIKDAHTCALSMQELIRRQATYLCEQRSHDAQQPWIIQVIILNHVSFMHFGDKRTLEIAERLQSLPIALARRRRLFDDVPPVDFSPQSHLSEEERWRMWIINEQKRRIGYAIWILDSSLALHFSLNQVMAIEEIHSSLPQSESLWSAPTAQAWVNSLPDLKPGSNDTLNDIWHGENWQTIWSRTGTLGKQAIVHYLWTVATVRPYQPFGLANQSGQLRPSIVAAKKLAEILPLVEKEQSEGSFSSSKASVALQLMIHTAQAKHYGPSPNLAYIVFRLIHTRLDDIELTEEIRAWIISLPKSRRAVFYASNIFNIVRDSRPNNFATSFMLLQAVIILWIFSRFSVNDALHIHDVTAEVYAREILLNSNVNAELKEYWVHGGELVPKMAGIGILTSRQGRQRLLEVAADIMKRSGVRGLRENYLQIIRCVREMEESDSL